MVRLKEDFKNQNFFDEIHFNSNMVRLKENIYQFDEHEPIFQFQYGSIKSQLPKE